MTLEEKLRAVIGNDNTNQLIKYAKAEGKTLEDIVSARTIPGLGRIEVFNSKTGSPRFLEFRDAAGKNISEDVGKVMGIDGVKSQLRIQSLVDNSVFTTAKGHPDNFNSSDMGKALAPAINSKMSVLASQEKQGERLRYLGWIQQNTSRLGSVFGFDDYQQLEVFIAAWLMKDSTCRLSGIPGTGKTTVINCASTLFANAYGHHEEQVLLCSPAYANNNGGVVDRSELYGDNDSTDNAYADYRVVRKGMEYDIQYNYTKYADVYRLWSEWRFMGWQRPDQSSKPTIQRSGAYLYPFEYLRSTSTELNYGTGKFSAEGVEEVIVVLPSEARPKSSMQKEELYQALNNVWVEKSQMSQKKKEDTEGNVDLMERDQAMALGRADTRIKPMKLFNKDGTMVDKADFKAPVGFSRRFLMIDYDWYANKLGKIPANAVASICDYFGVDGIYTDAGRNEGYCLRLLLSHYFFDSRVGDPETGKGRNLHLIASEMRSMVGDAKIDYDKRADEVLYGLEIQEVSNEDGSIKTFEFEPLPRPIVTRPVKFFNEANRSQSGVEDAILGLIAEKEVEYRGKTFTSPSFVAWMDTNPHQKGNDLAFTDRIDMELLFKSISLGGRYAVLGKQLGEQGLQPGAQLVHDLTEDKGSARDFTPLRFGDLQTLWQHIERNIKFKQPGGGYDALRDIASISVLFSQIYARTPGTLHMGEQKSVSLEWGNPHKDPLLDYSVTTNTVTTDAGTTSPLLEIDEAGFGQAAAGSADPRIYGAPDEQGDMQAPSVFTRILGFRFTNSLIKLSRALSFLRGKEYVGRSEILDALPYVIAHRMGRAKASGKDMEGNTKGVDGTEVKYVNEQQLVREAIVNSYLLRGVTSAQMSPGFVAPELRGQTGNLLELWDLFYYRCVSILESAPTLGSYESEILQSLQTAIRQGSVTGSTPVHWHLATMVAENERKAIGGQSLRRYGRGEQWRGMNKKPSNYKEQYDAYLSMILDPTSILRQDESIGGQVVPCLWDYYKVRGYVARERNLFADDRTRLLDLVESKIANIGGRPKYMPAGEPNQSAFPPAKCDPNDRPTVQFETQAQSFNWLTYYDDMGGYGYVKNLPVADVTSSSSPWETGFMETGSNINFTDPTAPGLSGQRLKIIGRFETKATDTFKDQTTFINAMSKIATRMGSMSAIKSTVVPGQSGYVLVNNKMNVDVPGESARTDMVAAKKVLDDNDITLDEFMAVAQTLVETSIPKDEDTLDLIGVFPLRHFAGIKPQMGLRGVKAFTPESDHLQLWVRIFRQMGKQTLADVEYSTFFLTMGVTSNMSALPRKTSNFGDASLANPDGLVPLPMDYVQQYSKELYLTSNNAVLYTAGKAASGKANSSIVDSGNMTMQDLNHYSSIFAECLGSPGSV